MTESNNTTSAQPGVGKTVELFYDTGSTNSYFALHLLKRLADAQGVSVVYQPFNLGYVFRANNYVLMDEPKAKLINRKRDLQRWAERYDLPFRMPDRFPIKTSPSLRAALAARHYNLEEEFLFAVFARYWEDNDASIDTDESLGCVAQSVGIDAAEFLQRLNGDSVRQALIDSTQSALDRGVFGAPTIVVGDEMFWGKDRMEFVADELARI